MTGVRRAVEPAVQPFDDEARLLEQHTPLLDRQPRQRELRLGTVAADAKDERARLLVPVGALEDARLGLEPAAVRLGDVVGSGREDVEDETAAFAQPNPGAYGNFVRNSIRGPGQWVINLALSRLLALGSTRSVEFRVEAFNLVNHFNWGVPVTNFGVGNFGRITSQATDPRIFQFGIKYGF